MTLHGCEVVLRALWLGCYGAAMAIGFSGAVRARRRSVAHGAGLAGRIGALPAYLVTAVPYYAACTALWRPIPWDADTSVPGLVAAAVLGAAGLVLYVGAHRALGDNYDVSGGLGTVVHDGGQLVTSGPYARVRHPMYLGIALGALSGLLLFRTWTFVWVLASLIAIARKARIEDRLLAEQFGPEFTRYQAAVPAWRPRFLLRHSAAVH